MQFSEIIAVLSLGVSLTSLAVSFLIAKFYGERWVEMARRRREHSIKLKEEVLKPWLTKIGEEYCKIDVVYSHHFDRIVGVEPKDPTDLEFFDVAKSHLESKYPEILKAWVEFKLVTSEHNKELAILLEEIRMLTIRELKMPCHYWRPAAETPEEYIIPDRFSQCVYQEMEWREPYKRKWASGEPRIVPTMHGNKKFYELEWGIYRLVKIRDEKQAENAILLINKIIETSRFREEAKNLTKRKNEIYNAKRENFEAKIKDLIKSIELGNNLRGKCRFCP